jgi:mitochondrial chaperone BCS1
MDVWINFTHATKWQAEGLFKCFFPSKPSPSSTSSNSTSSEKDCSQKNMPLPRRKAALTHAVLLLDDAEISELAKRFADAIPEDELSVSYTRFPFPRRELMIDDRSRLRVFKAIYSRTRHVQENA